MIYRHMENITWSGIEWLTRERWGRLHKDKPFVWYDPKCVDVDQHGYLHLTTEHSPTEIEINDKVYTPSLGAGLICSKEDFSYGKFEIVAKLPMGKKRWPAFWLWGADSWPPEIDILEGYTDNRNGYLRFNRFNFMGWWNVQTNIWTHKNGDKAVNLRAKTHFFGFKNPAKNFITYSLLWLPDKIRISYNGYLVREILDPEILKHFNNQKMRVVINNHFQPGFKGSDAYSDFVVKEFKYIPHEVH